MLLRMSLSLRMIFAFLAALAGSAANAQEPLPVAAAAKAAFPAMPDVAWLDQISGTCGADGSVHPTVAYCTSSNTILLAADDPATPEATYFLAHAYGHAVQVRHGVADVALREIRNRRDDGLILRGFVER